MDIEGPWVKSVLQAQMDAAKVLQWSLIDGWRMQRTPVNMSCPNLITEIRPQLDALTSKIIEELKCCASSRHEQEFKQCVDSHVGRLSIERTESPLVWKLSLGALLK